MVEVLARDEDFAVRLFLAESCDDAPSWLLLDLWTDGRDGTFSFPDRPLKHPNFPRADLLRFADDPHPRLRMLALDDPAAPAALAERFAHDPDPVVRARAHRHPALPLHCWQPCSRTRPPPGMPPPTRRCRRPSCTA